MPNDTTEATTPETDVIIWGAKRIGQKINRTTRQTLFLLERGALPARKVEGRWAASERKLREMFEAV